MDSQPDKAHEPFQMKVTWDDLSGVAHKDEQQLNFATFTSPYTTTSTGILALQFYNVKSNYAIGGSDNVESQFESSGIRKAILLVHYTDFFKKYVDLRGADSTPELIATYQV